MKGLFLKQFRDFKKGAFLNISVFVITLLGIFLFSGLNAAGRSIRKGVDDFYSAQKLADYTVTFNLDDDMLEAVREQLDADGAVSLDAVTLKVNGINRNIIAALFSRSDFKVNIPKIVDGNLPKASFEALLDVAFAQSNGIKVGDAFTLNIQGQPQNIVISGLAQFPDYLYKGEEIPLIEETGILKIFVDLDFEIDTLYISSTLSEKEIRSNLRALTGQSFASARILSRNENISVVRVKTDIELIGSLMNIIPIVCLIALSLILYINMSKRMEDESYNIGILSAIGINKAKIFASYFLPYFIWVMIGGIIGGIIGVFALPNLYISMLSRFYTLPNFPIVGIGYSIIIPIAVLIAVTSVSIFAALASILSLSPSALMKGKIKKSVRVLHRTKAPVSIKLGLRNFISYKKKTIFTILSATLCLGLLFTSFLLDNSVDYLQNTVYGKYYNYDVSISWNLGDKLKYEDIKADMEKSGLFEKTMYCFEFPASNLDTQSNVTVSIIDGSDPCYNLYDENGKIAFNSSGVYVPESYGNLISVELRIYAPTPFVLKLPVAGSYIDIGKFGIIVPIDALRENKSPAYLYLSQNTELLTTVYAVRGNGVTNEQMDEYISDIEDRFSAAFMLDEHSAESEKFNRLFVVLDITKALLFAVCGLIMILLILNISCLSIADRVKDYTVFKALGIGTNKINLFNSLENFLSVIFAYIFAIPTGMLITDTIIKVITQVTGIVVYLHLYSLSAVALFVGAMLLTVISNLLINKKIAGVNIASALKIKE